MTHDLTQSHIQIAASDHVQNKRIINAKRHLLMLLRLTNCFLMIEIKLQSRNSFDIIDN